jgi:hypothetical protein
MVFANLNLTKHNLLIDTSQSVPTTAINDSYQRQLSTTANNNHSTEAGMEFFATDRKSEHRNYWCRHQRLALRQPFTRVRIYLHHI